MTIAVNGSPVDVPAGTTVAAAVMRAGAVAFRPLCGMGICFECRVTLNGRPHERSCQILCEPGMEVRSDGGAA